jgi:hypothetical protein
MAREVYVPAPPASSVIVTAGQRQQVKLPGQRTSREVALEPGASTDIPVGTKGQAGACPDRTRAIPLHRAGGHDGDDEDQDAEVPTVVRDRRRRARYAPDRLVNAGYSRSLPGNAVSRLTCRQTG